MPSPPSTDFAPVAFFCVLSRIRFGKTIVRCVGKTSMRIVVGKRLMSSCAPAVSLSACCATFLLSITSRGFSLANGSGRMPLPFW
jgi:hypothetical protein